MLLQQTTRPTQWADWFEQFGADSQHALRGPRYEQFAMIAQAAVSGLGGFQKLVVIKVSRVSDDPA